MSADRNTQSAAQSTAAAPAAAIPSNHWQAPAAVEDSQYGAWCGNQLVQMMASPAYQAPVQRDGGDGGQGADQVHAAAARGTSTPSTAMPHGEQIQTAFGSHDISHVQAHVGGGAAEACGAMGASAFASGDHVAFARSPDLHTAAHEAAHVVQQAHGVNLYGGVGSAGDAYERHADAVADTVVAGGSAQQMLNAGPWSSPPAGGWAVQRKISAPIVQHKGGDGSGGASSTSDGTGGSEGASAVGGEVASELKPPVAKLHLYADIEAKSMGIKELKSGMVGHTWIALEYIDPATVPDSVGAGHKALLQNGGKYADPMGFWPDTENGVYYSSNPFSSYVQGKMRNPDRAHEGAEKASQTWTLNQHEADQVIAYAESKRGAQYSVYFYNCTHFGVGAVKAAGKSAPAATMAGIAMPNALYDGIKDRQKKGEGDTMTKDFDGANEVTTNGAEHAEKKNG